MSQKIELFITTAESFSNPTNFPIVSLPKSFNVFKAAAESYSLDWGTISQYTETFISVLQNVDTSAALQNKA
jgi:hypothetical protein